MLALSEQSCSARPRPRGNCVNGAKVSESMPEPICSGVQLVVSGARHGLKSTIGTVLTSAACQRGLPALRGAFSCVRARSGLRKAEVSNRIYGIQDGRARLLAGA